LGRPLYLLEQAFNAMGSPCEIKLYADSRARSRHVARRVIDEVERLEAKYSRYREDSYLSKINQVSQIGGSVTVDPETAGLLDYVATCWQQSNGLFDVTSGILRKVWSFRDQVLPEPSVIQTLLDRIGWHRLIWQSPTISFPEPGLELDLGGAVKEYAVDRIANLCWNAGIRQGLVNLGGDIKVIGPHPDGSPWAIGIRHPRNPSEITKTVYLKSGAMASSGDYERCILLGGRRYGHVLNPKTGWPVSHLASVSVVAEFCVVAGSASTIAMLMEEQGPPWLDAMGILHYWVDVDGLEGGNWA
jgi:thiamine biosynthesis lipoprotein